MKEAELDEALGDRDLTERLKSAGFQTLQQVFSASKRRLMSQNFGREETERAMMLAEERLRIRRLPRIILRGSGKTAIPTGVHGLDTLLGGGVRKGAVTTFFGPSGTGKTQFIHQILLMSLIAQPGSFTVLADTKGTFRPERILEMAEDHGRAGETLLDSVRVFRPSESAEQMEMAERLRREQDPRLGILLIDTGTYNFMGGQTELEGMKARSDLISHLNQLSRIAIEKDIPVVLTNDVRERMTHGFFRTVEAGGWAVQHNVQYRIRLSRAEATRERWLELVKPRLGGGTVRFEIDRGGIRTTTAPPR